MSNKKNKSHPQLLDWHDYLRTRFTQEEIDALEQEAIEELIKDKTEFEATRVMQEALDSVKKIDKEISKLYKVMNAPESSFNWFNLSFIVQLLRPSASDLAYLVKKMQQRKNECSKKLDLLTKKKDES